MTNAQFDGIIIGGGHNGLITAAYLAKAGLKIAVFEARPTVGGGFATDEVTAPGFKHHLHAHYCKIHESPAHSDLELARYGISYVFPNPKMAFVRHDSYFIYYQDREKTYQSIKLVSPKDAETFRVVSEKWHRWYVDFILPEIYSIPKPPEQWAAEIGAKPGGKEYLDVVLNYSPLQYASELFESEYCRLAFIRGSTAAEYDVDCKGIPALVFETILSWFNEKTAHVVGGIKQIPLACARIVKDNGGTVFENARVAKIIVENNVAKGIALEDGREIHASRFVASSINPVHTFLFLVGEDRLPQDVREKAENFKFRGKSLFRVHMALKERPRFTMAVREPSIDDAWKFTIGFETPGDFVKVANQIESGQLPDVLGVDFGIATVHDATQAPAGRHVAYVGLPVPFELPDGGAAKWPSIAKEMGDRLIAKLREYAPNMTDDNIIGRFAYTPKDIEEYLPDMIEGDICQGKICPEQLGYSRPWPGMSQYRTPISGLYLCGASTHPGGLAVGGPGYNAANAIADGIGVKKWWPAYDARKAVAAWEGK
jgi:phytoene dehydrogenase-like protein